MSAGLILTSIWTGDTVHDEHGRPLRQWVRDLQYGNRAAASHAEAIIHANGSNACLDLTRLLSKHDPFWSVKAWELGTNLPAPLGKKILGYVHEPDSFLTREAAAKGLALLGPAARPATPVLEAAVRDTEGRVAAEAADALGRLGGSVPIAPLISDLKDPNLRVRLNAIYALGQLGSDAVPAIPVLREQMADSPVRFQAASALAATGTNAIPVFIHALTASQPDLRAAAARGFALILARNTASLDTDSVLALAAGLKDPVVQVRIEVAEALGAAGQDATAALGALTEALDDSSAAVRQRAASALGEFGADAQAALPALRRLAYANVPPASDTAAKAIRRISPSS